VAVGYVGFVFGSVGGGFVVGAGINSENAEIARVPWPHPIVFVVAEFPDVGGWRGNHTDIGEHLG